MLFTRSKSILSLIQATPVCNLPVVKKFANLIAALYSANISNIETLKYL